MSAPPSATPRVPGALRCAPSRTRTARTPLVPVTAVAITAQPLDEVEQLYAGPPTAPATCALFPGHASIPPFETVGVHVRALARPAAGADLTVAVMLDLGANRDVARVELYGNPLLPPTESGGRPVHNLGLPHALALYAVEDEFDEVDLHGRVEPGVFDSRRLLAGREPSWATLDLRALHGWTPLHLPPTFGRYLVLVFRDLPLLFPDDGSEPRPGLDVQRIVAWPFLEDVDHRPHVEYAPVASRQRHYPGSSAYWQRVGVDPPDPDDHPSTGYDPQAEVLLLPSALCGIGDWSPAVGEVVLYASDVVAVDTPGAVGGGADDPRVHLTLQTTTDEVPILDGIRLHFRPTVLRAGYEGPKADSLPDYVMRVHVTNDREAAFSPDPAHPAWRPVSGPSLVPASRAGIGRLVFVEPVRARWVRLTASPRSPEGLDLGTARLQLSRVDLLRCRDFVLSPEPAEDIRVDHLLLRLRGERLLDDYAYVDGEHGIGLTLEARVEGGSFEELRTVRTLVELLEGTSHRVYANHRRVDKPVQRLHEVTDATTHATSEGTSHQTADSTTDILPEYGNRQVTRAGSVTTYTNRPVDNLGDAPFAGLPDETLAGLRTTRSFEVDLAAIGPPEIDPTLDAAAAIEDLVSWSTELAGQGVPVSMGFGFNEGFNLGASAGIQVGGSVGASVNVGTQVGGGITRSEVDGGQGSVVRSESHTVEGHSRQVGVTDATSSATQDSTSHDERDVVREDHSEEVRRAGVEVRYGGRHEDLILCALPVGRTLRGAPWSAGGLVAAEDVLRLRVDHLPPGVKLDVEFRGRVVPRERDA